ncbi:uncharacterized protein BHQ10_001917 [Talaromyces amestolkiae]|uniref:FAD/NAD(P)-binding domain-containing protein n=1 Tax=Talaromyces amestolkiae TaxID=1196081 RepID=A0A364KQT1_TALAM|nr:uncharacterized protein BHQ10_001917 [Talaromyces amestolkiae]RAO65905.1 hypothetical protein BHQ10_001917 [Talaromyces amestolkiae]
MNSTEAPATLTALKEKYAEERSKRLRSDGTAQYLNVRSPEIQDLAQDPWVDYEAIASQDAPLKPGGSIKFLIVGAGHNGCLFAARLMEAGFRREDIVLVDIAGGYGGTWYWNRYPGLMCDVEGYCYLPLLEETGYIPKHKYSFGAEIRGQSERIAAQYRFQAMFCTKVDKQVWDETKGRWIVDLTQSLGHVRQPTQITVDAQFVLLAGGILAIPKIPNAPGFAEFRTSHKVFHTSRWDYAVTGGSEKQPDMVNLRDKRVAIIGTGATSVQATPHLAKWAKHLYVIQRTPSYCGERGQRETTPADWNEIADGPGWQRRRVRNLNSYLTADPESVDLVNDGWSQNQARAGLIGSSSRLVDPESVEEHYNKLVEMDLPFAEALRARIDQLVKDPDTAEKLKPWYPGWCKRPTFNDDYLEAFNKDNVSLVNTDGKGIESYTTRGIVVANQELDIDVLVLATGFSTASQYTPAGRQNAPIIGRGGRHIDDKWDNPDFGTIFGIASHDYPNFFSYHSRGTASSFNMTSAFDAAARLVAYIVREASQQSDDPGKLIIEASKEAEDRWTDEVAKRAAWFSVVVRCTPSYFNREGEGSASQLSPQESARKARKAAWGSGINDYERVTEAYMKRVEKRLEGFILTQASI